MNPLEVHVVGGGLAGSEVVFYLASRGHTVFLHEMRPKKMTEVHKTSFFSELVCSNSFKSMDLTNAEGLLKAEMQLLGSVNLKCAYENRIPAGKALAVDREKFSKCVTEEILKTGVKVIREEITEIDPKDGEIWVIATGPATSDKLAEFLKKLTGTEHMFFFDAAAPIVEKDSIDMDKAFIADRYGKGTGDHINCPLTEEEYDKFWHELVNAEVIPMEDFDKKLLFERCKPVEDIARSGKDALRYGPMKPVGLIDPKTGREPFAVVQLRKDNIEGTLYNIVGFQTRLKWGEQKRVFRMIPCLRNAEFARYGVVHRNIYINAPAVLDPYLRLKQNPKIFFAGQIVGVEGYMESAAAGLYVAFNIDRILNRKDPLTFPRNTMIGALLYYITEGVRGNLRPMYANFGLLPKLTQRAKSKYERRKKLSMRAIENMKKFLRGAI